MSQLIGLVTGPGRGFEIAQTIVTMTPAVAILRGECVQCTMDANGEYSTCTGAGASNIAITAGDWEETGLILTQTGAFTNYTFRVGDRIQITGGTNAVAGFYTVASRVSADAITLTATIGASADESTDITGTLLDFQLMRGHFAIAKADVAAGAKGQFYLSGRVYAYTRNSADAAIAAGNLFFPTGAKDLNSGLAAAGLNAKFVAEAVATAAVSTTATRALRLVNFNGLADFGGTYAGVA